MSLFGKMVIFMAILATTAKGAGARPYQGQYCSGTGDAEYLQLIDESFGFFHPNPDTLNISMLYSPDWDCLIEGFPSWMGWWIQNTYGPTYCSLPFLQEPWVTFLQHSQDMWFKNQGDGKTKRQLDLIGPDGCLCDCATPDTAYYVQGDCRWQIHDWALEFTAAGVVMQSELLLISHDENAARKYLPNLERACTFIETRRDPKNGLFLAGPAANLLGPSYGGIKQPDGTFGKGYLAGLSVNYLAAVDRMIELERLVGAKEKAALFESRRKATSDSLRQLLTPEGYFVKSIELNGTKHGVFGQKKYGYFEAAPNVDAVCFRAVDQAQSEKIYAKIASIPQLRPHDFLITNYPSLDDTYANWDSTDLGELWEYGRWVNGGVWATMEARAIMAYYRLGEYDDIRRSNLHSMKLADRYQLDAPLTDFGNDVWFKDRLTNLCIDALGIPAATVRGLFEYVYSADSLTLYPHVPPFLREYAQKEPVRFGEKRITISIQNGGPRIMSLKVNDADWKVTARDHVTLPYDRLPKNARIAIRTEGVWPASETRPRAPTRATEPPRPRAQKADSGEAFAPMLSVLTKMRDRLSKDPYADFERAFVSETIRAIDAFEDRASRDAAGAYPQFTSEKRAAILKMHQDAAMNMYKGFDALMKRYSAGTGRQKRIARLWKTSNQ